MNLHGHSLYLDEARIKTELLERRERLRSHYAGRPEMVELALSFDSDRYECRHCGRRLALNFDANENLVLQSQGPSVEEFVQRQDQDPSEFARKQRDNHTEAYPIDTPCPLANVKSVTVPFTCRSGRIALGNDFRRHFESRPNFDRDYPINFRAGKIAWMQHMATFGYLLGCVGNTSVHFVPREGGLDVVHLSEPEGTYSEKRGCRPSRSKLARKVLSDEKASVHRVSTELWWFAIVDAADLPEGATDSYDRKIGHMDLPPGEYEMTYHFASRNQDWHHVTWAEIRRK